MYKTPLNESIEYTNKIREEIKKIGTLSYHSKSRYEVHKKHGKYIYRYDANRHTQWYIIYDIDENGGILIKKILNNHMTINGISGLPEPKNGSSGIIVALLLVALYAIWRIGKQN